MAHITCVCQQQNSWCAALASANNGGITFWWNFSASLTLNTAHALQQFKTGYMP